MSDHGEMIDAAFGGEKPAIAETPPVQPAADQQPPAQETPPAAPAANDGEPNDSAGLRAALQAERRKRQEAEARLSQPRETPPEQRMPDMTPEQRAQWDARNRELNLHEISARAQYGRDNVEGAKQWFQSVSAENPRFAAFIQNSDFPYETLMEEYGAALERYRWGQLVQAGFDPNAPEESLLSLADRIRSTRQPPPQQDAPQAQTDGRARDENGRFASAPPQPSAAPPPPRSLVSAPSAGSKSTPAEITGGDVADRAFNGR